VSTAAVLVAPSGWTERAACYRPSVDPSLFFGPDDEPDDARAARERKAKAVCSGCPVRAECLGYALAARVTAGVWGGFGETDLTNYRRSLSARTRHTARLAAAAAPVPAAQPAEVSAVAPGNKRCAGNCGQVKPLGEFHRHARSLDGHYGTCITCRNSTRNRSRNAARAAARAAWPAGEAAA
jgi:WhiB family redox-sensing transcriptional regulator